MCNTEIINLLWYWINVFVISKFDTKLMYLHYKISKQWIQCKSMSNVKEELFFSCIIEKGGILWEQPNSKVITDRLS